MNKSHVTLPEDLFEAASSVAECLQKREGRPLSVEGTILEVLFESKAHQCGPTRSIALQSTEDFFKTYSDRLLTPNIMPTPILECYETAIDLALSGSSEMERGLFIMMKSGNWWPEHVRTKLRLVPRS